MRVLLNFPIFWAAVFRDRRHNERAMSYDAIKRLELYGVLEGLHAAVRRDDSSNGRGFWERLGFSIEYARTGDPAKPIYDKLVELFEIGGEWLRGFGAVQVDSCGTKQQMLKMIDSVIELLALKDVNPPDVS